MKKLILITFSLIFGAAVFCGCKSADDGRAMPKVTPWWEVQQ